MEIPDWLKGATSPGERGTAPGERGYEPRRKGLRAPAKRAQPKEKFLDRTLRHSVSFVKDALFNEKLSAKKGVLQKVEPRLKLSAAVVLIFAVSIQKHPVGLAIFISLSLLLAILSRIPLTTLLGKIFPVFLFTLFIASPSVLNLVVRGEGIATLFTLKSAYKLGPISIPQEITVTKTGLISALTLVLRVTASVLIVFLQTLTTPPAKLIKAASFFLPGTLKSIFSISYRYIFFLLKRLEEFITAYRSRNISGESEDGKAASPGARGGTASGARAWAASRMGMLFSISLNLSKDLQMAMESRGCTLEAPGKERRK